MEKRDEGDPNLIGKGVSEIEKIINQLKVKNLVILPFAHLFGQLSSLEYAFDAFKKFESIFISKNYTVLRLALGWFNELEMKAKGHPLSRISRIIE